MTTATHMTIECRVTAGEREALAELLPVLAAMVKNRVISLRKVDAEAAESGLAKLIERTKDAEDWG